MFFKLRFKDLLAPIATCLSAAAAVWGVTHSIDSAKDEQYRRNVFDLYDAHWKDAMQRPRLALGIIDIPIVDSKQAADKFRKSDKATDDFLSYEWLVARMLRNNERLLALVGNEYAWATTIRKQIGLHKSYFASDFFTVEDYMQYTGDIRIIICQEIGTNNCKRFWKVND